MTVCNCNTQQVLACAELTAQGRPMSDDCVGKAYGCNYNGMGEMSFSLNDLESRLVLLAFWVIRNK